jgi:hypothetical protein
VGKNNDQVPLGTAIHMTRPGAVLGLRVERGLGGSARTVNLTVSAVPPQDDFLFADTANTAKLASGELHAFA